MTAVLLVEVVLADIALLLLIEVVNVEFALPLDDVAWLYIPFVEIVRRKIWGGGGRP